jgi:NADH dehydrogenase/NADH:ubiquinone oxidoreductase subunit G
MIKVNMTITLTIDGQEVTTEPGKTLLDVARENGIDIPTICFHEATTANALCRICVVDLHCPGCKRHEGSHAQ